ncbi:flavin reductase family protein [Methylovirgula sp. 4M-Z18]|uniref:flavin reductase family protein n=1 Tax=Methylovirgula sp. 4M-Z18 TaxID=2293567 RepID=UPI000E2FC602|nr:flavin reductase [Methylovirgula sp. 4M-Z18]RFB76329.1 flavin reductase family protein [Methylovirgula sp. 4M-Z18]
MNINVRTRPAPSHIEIHPSVLYVGTPIVLMTTCNADGSANITPMSSAWALSDRMVLGLQAAGQGAANVLRTRECVLNFPSAELWPQVENIAHTTGRDPVPNFKAAIGFVHCADKFALGNFTAQPSRCVMPPRIVECPLQMEAKLVAAHELGQDVDAPAGPALLSLEVRVLKVHALPSIVVPGTNHVDTAQWHPLFYVFRHYFSVGPDLGKTFRAEI